ncbi:sigma-70 family RNA polymerase sigma factor [Neobacillus sp. FSL H8-0543]|uniref:sigma-70 family RNA polymerase sigma factor n=1 Tax=Neobacillus sp. FSL H8-0543 TaxID=2954672 RepID=UPI0031587652
MNKNHKAFPLKRKDRQYPKIIDYQQTRCKKLATNLLLAYKHLVDSTARKLSRSRPEFYDDLFQVGQMSLLRSLERYDQGHGSSFETYARTGMMGSMMNYLRDKAWISPMPRWMKEKSIQVQRVIDDLMVKQERPPSISEIVHHSNLPEEVTMEVLAGQASFQVTSLDAPMSGEVQVDFQVADVIGTEAKEYQEVETRMDVSQAWSYLSEKEKQVVHLSFFEEASQRTIAIRLGISQMTVNRTLKRALEKLKQGLYEPVPSI